MSSSLHIVRGPQWDENPKHQIIAAEWIAYIDANPDLLRLNSQHPRFIEACLSSNKDEGQILCFRSGIISSDYPQPPLLKKMFEIANHFNGYLVTDDGDIINPNLPTREMKP